MKMFTARTKKHGLIVLSAFMAVALAACGGGATSGGDTTASEPAATEPAPAAEAKAHEKAAEPVNIIITNGKGEITSQWEQAAKDFMAANPDITVETRSAAVGDALNVFDMMTASGKTVTIAMFEPSAALNKYKDVYSDLSNEQWVSETDSALKNEQGQVVGFPFAIEGFGLVYNKQVVEKAAGGAFDPFSINTRDKLVELFDKLQASGVTYPVAYQTESWSVSNHYSTQFINQAADPTEVVKQLEAGTLDLASNATWNGYYDTMDLLASKKYNKYGERPLGSYYDDAHVAVGKGESAVLFNGNWAYDSLQAVAGDDFGFIPVPVDNDPANPLNGKIAAGATQVLVINKAAKPEEQEAAKKFLNWLVYDAAGQDFIVNKSQVISAFKNNPNKVTNPLGAAIGDAIANSRTMPFSTNYVLAEEWNTIIGPEVQKYIVGKNTREDLAKFIQNYYAK
ncbi:carbohydrate ABC transporter substrate-binding protein [Paenibacillus antri]|uniref:Carbohydrate ABC transporter substrate-binding protein n=1 Tax=Paenibacillus antri TaxID=2582848 RepID=A0A5R9GC43_9BACL|nr:ABC transporter substrate-binding protein [Paenibacillus antri]TLS51630.1 carbohydrate ABC transporter substrate-binding protein [Paenibacillus antri]